MCLLINTRSNVETPFKGLSFLSAATLTLEPIPTNTLYLPALTPDVILPFTEVEDSTVTTVFSRALPLEVLIAPAMLLAPLTVPPHGVLTAGVAFMLF